MDRNSDFCKYRFVCLGLPECLVHAGLKDFERCDYTCDDIVECGDGEMMPECSDFEPCDKFDSRKI